jgi:hypothetical protein
MQQAIAGLVQRVCVQHFLAVVQITIAHLLEVVVLHARVEQIQQQPDVSRSARMEQP